MNLLVTNSHSPQAYAIIRALRPHARRIVATFEGTRFFARLSPGANSRLVDRSYRVPSPVSDWWHGHISADNTPIENEYIAAILLICVSERIDVIYPSWDPYVYVLSKNRKKFESLGITVPVPDLDTVLTALDKYRTVEAGRFVGFPCPDTVLYDAQVRLDDVSHRLGFPLVVKPRFTSGGHGMAIIRDRAELEVVLPGVVAKHGNPLLQEYIPGGKRDSVQFVMARDGTLLFAFHKLRQRTFRRTARFGTVSESAAPDGRVLQSSGLLSHLG